MYECGQGLDDWQDDSKTALLEAVNADPGMGLLYQTYLSGLESAGVSLANFFNDCGTWNKWGCWGHRQDLSMTTPKGNAIFAAAVAATTSVTTGNA